jgi:hypothetical protein
MALVISAGAQSPAIDPAAYPEIGDQELGQLRWTLMIADQEVGDFSNMEGEDQYGMAAYRYQLAFMSYFLALEQYHKLPACPEIIQPRMDRFIQKIIQKPVWEFWAEISQGIKNAEPLMNRPYPEVHDPVGDINIMYSGHLGHMIGLYETLYRDFKWSKPGSIVFEWSEDEKYVYDFHSLTRVMADQMRDNPWRSIACEPNMIFPECNQHPVLAFMLYDHAHGTDVAEVRHEFFDFFLERKLIHPKTHETAMYYLAKQDIVVSQQDPRFGNLYDLILFPAAKLRVAQLGGPTANGWTGSMMHAWQPEYIERHYPYQRDASLRMTGQGKARLKKYTPELLAPGLHYGFFSMLAAEVGDMQTRDLLLEQADEIYEQQWRDGTLHYPDLTSGKANVLTGILIANARANPGKGYETMHNRPFDDEHFKEPYVSGVDFPNVVLRRAVYDSDRKALIVTTEPGTEKGGVTQIKVNRLDPQRTYRLLIDGKKMKTLRGREEALLEVTLDARHDIVLIAE